MRIANRQFSPKLWAVLLYLVVLLAMLSLGRWQLNRAAQKVSLQQAADLSALAAPTALPLAADLDEAVARYQRVKLEGYYDETRQFLWDNRTHKGVAGFEVITPFKTLDDRLVLLNRGWIAPGPSRAQLPNVSLPAAATATLLSVEGFLSRPSQGFSSGPAIEASADWPKLLQHFDYDALSSSLGEPLVPLVVQGQTLGIDGDSQRAAVARPEWLIANWQPAASGPIKHYSYAFQWFAMAIALTVLFLVINLRPLAKRAVSHSKESRVNTNE